MFVCSTLSVFFFVMRFSLFVVGCVSLRCPLCVVRCVLCVACCLLSVACCLLLVVSCLLFGVVVCWC